MAKCTVDNKGTVLLSFVIADRTEQSLFISVYRAEGESAVIRESVELSNRVIGAANSIITALNDKSPFSFTRHSVTEIEVNLRRVLDMDVRVLFYHLTASVLLASVEGTKFLEAGKPSAMMLTMMGTRTGGHA